MSDSNKPTGPESAEEYRALMLSLIASLTLCDHMGDVAEDVNAVLKRLGASIKIKWGDWEDLRDALHAMGVKTLYGTSLGRD